MSSQYKSISGIPSHTQAFVYYNYANRYAVNVKVHKVAQEATRKLECVSCCLFTQAHLAQFVWQ